MCMCAGARVPTVSSQVSTSTALIVTWVNAFCNLGFRSLLLDAPARQASLRLFLACFPAVAAGSTLGTYVLLRLSMGAIRVVLYGSLLVQSILVAAVFSVASTFYAFVAIATLIVSTVTFVIIGIGGYIRSVAA